MTRFDAAHFYTEFAAAFCRGRLDLTATTPTPDALAAGIGAELRLFRFKRNAELPRVRRVLGILRGLGPGELLDLGSGRGTFLWPVLDAFPWMPVTAVDADEVRARDLTAVGQGGVSRLVARQEDVTALPFDAGAFDVVTALEVLEHLEDPAAAAREIVRVGRRFAVVSVPSREDDNPEHIQLFDEASLRSLFLEAGAHKVGVEFVPDHMVAVVSLDGDARRG